MAGLACGGSSPGAADDTASNTLSAGEEDAAVPSHPTPPPSESDAAAAPDAAPEPPVVTSPPDPPAPQSCTTDDGCVEADLCVAHVCQQACRSNANCASNFCNFDHNGHCWNEHGCNPAPVNTMCPMICWGFCDAEPDAG